MSIRALLLISVASQFFTHFTLAETMVAPDPAVPAKTSKSVAKVNSKTQKTYSESPEGIRSLLKDLERNQKKIYLELKPEGETLISKMETAQNIALYSTLGGIGVLGYTMIRTFSGSSSAPSSEGDEFNFFTGFLISAGLVLGGRIASYFVAPDRQEILDFINRHNELNPRDQLEHKTSISISMAAEPTGGKLGLRLHF